MVDASIGIEGQVQIRTAFIRLKFRNGELLSGISESGAWCFFSFSFFSWKCLFMCDFGYMLAIMRRNK